MTRVMAVSFERYGRLYYLDPGERVYRVGERVLVPTESGPEVAECVWAPEWVDDEGLSDLPVCAGPAQDQDLARDAANRRRRAEAKLVAKKLIRRHDLAMKVVAVDFVDSQGEFDELIVIYFTAPHRVDFRALVGELARSLRARIDLRQIGSRDSARLVGGLGNCGRDLCCATFLSGFEPVSLRMAKVQDLPLNPMRISGACGRLMCCLKYEHPLYTEFAREAPAVGSAVTTDEGEGVVVAHQVPADALLVRLRSTGAVSSCSKAGVCGSRQSYEARPTPEPDPVAPASPAPASPAPASPAPASPAPVAPALASAGDLERKPRQRRRRSEESE